METSYGLIVFALITSVSQSKYLIKFKLTSLFLHMDPKIVMLIGLTSRRWREDLFFEK